MGDARFLFEAFGPDLEGFDGVSDDQKARGIATAIQFSDFVESTWSNPSEVPDVILAMLIRLKKAGMLEPILGGQ